MIKKISKLLPVIGIVLLVYVIYNIGAEKIVQAFLSVPIQYYVFSLLLFIPRLFIFTYKWQFISKKQKLDFNLLYLAKISLICLFYGSVTPSSIGWHLRIYYLRKKSKAPLEKCIANSLVDNGIGFIAGLSLALIGSILLIEEIPGLFPILFFLFILYNTIFIFFMKKERGSKIFNFFIKPFIPAKYKEMTDKSIESLYQDMPRIRDIFFPLLLEIITWILGAIQVYIIALAFSIDVPIFLFILISIIATIAGSIPISVGGLGVREGTIVVLLSIFGVEPHTAFVISLSGFLVKALIPGLIGWIISFKNN